MVSGGIKDPIATWIVIGARRPAFAGAHEPGLPAGQIESIDLVAPLALSSGLKNQSGPIGGEVSLGILSGKGELSDVGQMTLSGVVGESARVLSTTDAGPNEAKSTG